MYNTLGNLSLNPTTSILFIDFETGDAVQLSVRADIASKPSTQRPVAPTARGLSRRPGEPLAAAARLKGELLAMSRHNP